MTFNRHHAVVGLCMF